VLALSKNGTRVIQKIIEQLHFSDAKMVDSRNRLIKAFQGSYLELCLSKEGNHAVQIMIDKWPPTTLGCLLDELKGSAVTIAKSQFACRIWERLLEHYTGDEGVEASGVQTLVEEVLQDVEPLCRHPYGNFVVQHIFEHGCKEWKERVVQQVNNWGTLSQHRTASHVVQKALNHSTPNIVRTIVLALLRGQSPPDAPDYLKGAPLIVHLACTRYGSFVVEELHNTASKDEIHKMLQNDIHRLAQPIDGSKPSPGMRTLVRYGIELPASSCGQDTLT